MSFSLIPAADSFDQERQVQGTEVFASDPSKVSPSRTETTPTPRPQQTVHSGRRVNRERGRNQRRRRTTLRRQSSSPGPPPLLISASHFTNDNNGELSQQLPPSQQQQQQQLLLLQSQGSDTSAQSRTRAEMAAVNLDEMAAERLRREEEESIALARMLMAEEARESYMRSADLLQQNAQFYSPEDLQALQAVLQEDGDDASSADDDLSYDTMVRLGERIGDVKGERWALIARDEINKLEEFTYCAKTAKNHETSLKQESENDSFVKCLVCQCTYEQNERLRKLPCGHCFHSDCVGSWLMEKDSCPYCRQPVIPDHNY